MIRELLESAQDKLAQAQTAFRAIRQQDRSLSAIYDENVAEVMLWPDHEPPRGTGGLSHVYVTSMYPLSEREREIIMTSVHNAANQVGLPIPPDLKVIRASCR